MKNPVAFAIGVMIATIGVAVAADPPVIHQKNREFSPVPIEVKQGGELKFLNDDDTVHHVYVDTPGSNTTPAPSRRARR